VRKPVLQAESESSVSGSGHLSAHRPMPGTRGAAADRIARDEERDACVDFIRGKMAEVDAMRDRGRIAAHEAAQLNRRLDALADGIAAGLHR
jgi:hypothetical protein